MSLEVIDAQRVKTLLPMQECIDVMAQAMAAACTVFIASPSLRATEVTPGTEFEQTPNARGGSVAHVAR